jgi:hypothetical protein
MADAKNSAADACPIAREAAYSLYIPRLHQRQFHSLGR